VVLEEELANSCNLVSNIPKAQPAPIQKAVLNEFPSKNEEKLYPEIKEILKTVSVTNIGTETIKNAFLDNVLGVAGDKVPLPEIEVGKSFNTIVVMKSPMMPGQFSSFWRVCVNESDNRCISETIPLDFAILEKPVVVVSKPVVVEKTVTSGKEYSPEVVKKAKQLLEILPQYTLEFLEDAVESAGNADLEDLMINLMN